ncbi:WS/DGAT domain-containing protein [Lentzea sp. NBC_00516]|uniref:wax ester/triacylglycerol synthase domain-containing protein n=1 Tax=Lentzea sp. NBC_00516 TaxID=2903582 RepID=UPI002E81746F|nr:wax ester/triacylglycerol synthase domain-containing protein [Lentzea sp. NBC_00516]WUD27647.1 WS/DGAT domain-containing protein [Lentzea sp. NBC_00516]
MTHEREHDHVRCEAVERASSNDVMELVCDSTGTSMQVAAVLVLETPSPADIAAVRAAIAERITAVPRLRQRLVRTPFGQGRPVWIDDPSFAIADHVSAVGCPAPGDEQALLDVVADRLTRRLPPDSPLWSATLVTGLADARSAVVVVFHHVLADGIGGLAVLTHLVDGVPILPRQGFPRAAPRRRDLLVDVWRSRARAVRRLPAAAGRLRAAAAELGGGAHPPRCSLNRPTGTGRVLAVARADLSAVRAAAHAQGGTINDVVVTAVSGALGAVLAGRGEPVDRLVISVPVSARQHATTELGNQVGVIPVEVPTGGDPVRRLAAVARITRQRRTGAPGSSAVVIAPVFRALAKIGVYGWFVDRQRLVNTFVSNLRGPEHRLSFLGAPVVDVIAVSGISGNVTVAFVALSYAGTLNITAIADPERCPDLEVLAEGLRRELRVLSGAAEAVSLPRRSA